MKSPRPQRVRKEKVRWGAAVTRKLHAAKKAEQKAPRTSKTEALKLIPLADIVNRAPSITLHPSVKDSKKAG
jgi:hypothetical protein